MEIETRMCNPLKNQINFHIFLLQKYFQLIHQCEGLILKSINFLPSIIIIELYIDKH